MTTRPRPTRVPPNSDPFRFAQLDVNWAIAAAELTHAAHSIYFAASEQMPVFETAQRKAQAEADAALTQSDEEHAVAVIKAHPPQFLPAFLLYGFAIENLLKGLFVRKNPDAVRSERIGVPRTHNLVELAEKAGFEATPEEADCLGKLTTITTWSGRYPVPVTQAQYGNTWHNRDAIFKDPISAGVTAQQLVQRLMHEIVPGGFMADVGGAIVASR